MINSLALGAYLPSDGRVGVSGLSAVLLELVLGSAEPWLLVLAVDGPLPPNNSFSIAPTCLP